MSLPPNPLYTAAVPAPISAPASTKVPVKLVSSGSSVSDAAATYYDARRCCVEGGDGCDVADGLGHRS